MLRVLVVAPDQPGLNARPEIRQVQRRHHMSVLDGVVTPEDIYTACQETAFDVHHYATDSGPEGVLLSNGVLFTPEDVAQVARMKDTACLFFNSCDSGRLASYAVRHGARYAVYTNIRIEDNGAWKPALAFYDALKNGGDFVGAYLVADSGDGDYGLCVSPGYVQELQRTAATAIVPKRDTLIVSKWHMVWFALMVLAASGIWTMLINALSGR